MFAKPYRKSKDLRIVASKLSKIFPHYTEPVFFERDAKVSAFTILNKLILVKFPEFFLRNDVNVTEELPPFLRRTAKIRRLQLPANFSLGFYSQSSHIFIHISKELSAFLIAGCKDRQHQIVAKYFLVDSC
jgi:hypothetical protein